MERLVLKKSQWFQERLINYPRVLVILYVLGIIIILCSVFLSPSGMTDLMGYPLGRDFAPFWVASSMAQAGTPAEVYNLSKFMEAHEDLFRVFNAPYGWFYPPTFLLIVYPSAVLPYPLALAVWLAVTMGVFLLVMRLIAPHPRTLWLAIAFPGTFINFIFSQNGFLSAAMLGGGIALIGATSSAGGVPPGTAQL